MVVGFRLGVRAAIAFVLWLSFPSFAMADYSLHVVVMGDSVSAGNGVGEGGTPNWVSQLQATGDFLFDNLAQGGASSGMVANGSQLSTAYWLASHHQIDASVLIIGGVDATENPGIQEIFTGDFSIFANAYFQNVKTILDAIQAADSHVMQVFGNMPDVTVAPLFIEAGAEVGFGPAERALLSLAIAEANRLANAYALSIGIPVIDRYNASRDFKSYLPWTLGGHTFTSTYAVDDYHPATLVQGLMANMISTALNETFGLSLPLLSDEEIVLNAGFEPDSQTMYFNIRPYVLLPSPGTVTVPEVSSLGMLTCLAGSISVWRMARRRRSLRAVVRP